jgi:hypothetical protein
MLNKDVCINCINKNRISNKEENSRKIIVWDKNDERWWEQGKVLCPSYYFKNNNTLSDCLYKLEHLLKGN